MGLSLGVGLTLIYLQERFVRERRLLVAMGESERAKSAKMLKDLDNQWESTCAQYKEDIEKYKTRLAEAQQRLEAREPDNNDDHDDNEAAAALVEAGERINILAEELERFKAQKAEVSTEELQKFQHDISVYQQEIKDLQAEITFLKGEVKRLQDAKKNQLPDDYIVLSDSGHLLPGSVARAFMKSGKGD
ncbi:hypothetical protein MNBD_DELTA03-1290 [hydrothermal vent metagenome]|uniref:Uncharacterized protein n=1 Tax=hydrothermal vent metagenome TaxID=652676 RepID=A0A3B0VFA0_9ZZZZ